jgi:prophage antirepressor-like protein
MLHEIQKFSNSEVFSITLENEPPQTRYWFRATDLCAVLFDQKNAFRFVKQHCKDWQYREFQVGLGRPAIYVCESGVYRLILKSKALVAIEFQDWLTEGVLPKLRSTGFYMAEDITREQIEAAYAELAIAHDRIATLEATQRSLLSSAALTYSTAKKFADLAYIRDLRATTDDNERSHKYPAKCTNSIQKAFCAEFSDYFASSHKFRELCDRLKVDPQFAFPDFGWVHEYDEKSEFPVWTMVWFLEQIFAHKKDYLAFDTDYVQQRRLAIA